MEILPRDLDDRRRLAVIARRLHGRSGALSPSPPAVSPAAARVTAEAPRKRRPEPPTALWVTRGLDMPEEVAAQAAALAWNGPLRAMTPTEAFVLAAAAYVPLGLALMLTAVAGQIAGASLLLVALAGIALATRRALARRARLRLRQADAHPLTEMEVADLLPSAAGSLEAAYLRLLRDAIRARVPSVTAQKEMREALTALDRAIAALPAEPLLESDAAAMTVDAKEIRAQAERETDPVVRDSLLRQATSAEARSATANESARIARRIHVVACEVEGQISALRTLLALADAGAADRSEAEASRLAGAVQAVTRNAHATLLAHEELANEDLAALLSPQTEAAAPSSQTPTPPTPHDQQMVLRRRRTGGSGSSGSG